MGDIYHKDAIPVAGTAVQLFPGLRGRFTIWVKNTGGTNPMRVGTDGVTLGGADDGYTVVATAGSEELAPGGIQCLNPENLYGVATGAATTTAQVLAIRRE